jgi:hypothetical protein
MGKEYIREFEARSLITELGSVLMWDDFESGLVKWIAEFDAGGTLSIVSDVNVLGGKYALKIDTTGTPADGDQMTAIRHVPKPQSKGLKLTLFYLLIPAIGTLPYESFDLDVQNGDDLETFWVRFNPSTQLWEVLGEGDVWSSIPGSSDKIETGCWHRLELEVDLINWQFLVLRVDDLIIDMKGIKSVHYPYSGIGGVGLSMGMYMRGTPLHDMMFDNVLIEMR